jgi:cytochrome c oxidase subunit 3
MTTETGTIETSTLSEYRYKTNSNRLGLWLFIISDAFVFLGLLVSRFYLLGFDYHPETNQVLGVIITLMLLLSSYTMYRGEVSMSFGDTPGFIRNAMFTMILGTLFLIGVVGVEWGTSPAGTADGAVWSLFYTMTGFHAFHVLTGVFIIFTVWRKARMGKYNSERYWGVEAATMYWHFVDIVWFFFYPALYLIGKPLM